MSTSVMEQGRCAGNPCVVRSAGGKGEKGVEACGSVAVTSVAGEVSLHVSLFLRFLFLLAGVRDACTRAPQRQ